MYCSNYAVQLRTLATRVSRGVTWDMGNTVHGQMGWGGSKTPWQKRRSTESRADGAVELNVRSWIVSYNRYSYEVWDALTMRRKKHPNPWVRDRNVQGPGVSELQVFVIPIE